MAAFMAMLTSGLTVLPTAPSAAIGFNGIGPELEDALDFARAEKSTATRRAYRSDFEIFRTWCERKGLSPLPAHPESVAAFLAAQAKRGVRASTIGRRLAAIGCAHKMADYSSPTSSEAVKATLRGIKRTIRTSPARKAPVTSEKIVAMAMMAGTSHRGLRDRAVLLLGFAGAFRRSELVALDASDLQFCDGGLRVRIRRSKTDQEADGAIIAIVPGSFACPVKATQDWLDAARITRGPIFRAITKNGRVLARRLSDRAVAELVKAYARKIGLDAAEFSGHSLRSGFLTSAARHGASLFKMMDVSRHKSVDTLRAYVRDAELFQNHAGSGLL
jgi:site-specific recombinase XerD